MDDFEQITLQDLEEELKKDLMPSKEVQYENVKKYAIEFREKFEKLTKLKGGIIRSTDLQNQIFKDKMFNEKVYDAFFKFQNALLLYLDETVKVIFVYRGEDKIAHLGVVENSAEHLKQGIKGTIQYNLKEIKNVLVQENYKGSEQLLNTFNQVELVRWERALETHEKKVWLPILWLENGKWAGATVNNRGTLAEAYASFYINEEQFFNKQHADMEINVKYFIMNGATQVDNRNGFLIGDVKKGNINFAVKKDMASPQKILAIYKFLSLIMKDIDNPEIFVGQLVDKFRTKEETRRVATQAKKLTENEAKEMADKMIKNIVESVAK